MKICAGIAVIFSCSFALVSAQSLLQQPLGLSGFQGFPSFNNFGVGSRFGNQQGFFQTGNRGALSALGGNQFGQRNQFRTNQGTVSHAWSINVCYCLHAVLIF